MSTRQLARQNQLEETVEIDPEPHSEAEYDEADDDDGSDMSRFNGCSSQEDVQRVIDDGH